MLDDDNDEYIGIYDSMVLQTNVYIFIKIEILVCLYILYDKEPNVLFYLSRHDPSTED